MSNVSPRYTETYRKGYLAGRRGYTGADNPYENGSLEAWVWIIGMRQLTVVEANDMRKIQFGRRGALNATVRESARALNWASIGECVRSLRSSFYCGPGVFRRWVIRHH